MKLFQICYKSIVLFLLFICVSGYVLADDLLPIEDDFDISEIVTDIESIETSSDNSQMILTYQKL